MSAINYSTFSPKKIWHGVSDPNNYMQENIGVRKAILGLLNGHTKSGDMENLQGRKICSLRVNGKHRVLLTNVDIDSKVHLLILDVLLEHKYDKSKFMRDKGAVERAKNQDHEICIVDTLEDNQKLDVSDPAPIQYYHDKYIYLSDAQGKVLHAKTPAIISGPPGSGKSCMALASIEKYLSKPENRNGKIIYYVCLSNNLAEAMQQMWEQMPASQFDGSSEVIFTSYENLIRSYESMPFVNEADVNKWFSDQLKMIKKMSSNQENQIIKEEDRELVFEEFQILSCYEKKEYMNLGEEESLFETLQQKEMVWNLFKRYRHWLEGKNIDLRFYTFPEKVLSDLTIADEAADLSPYTVLQLHKITKDGSLVLFLDTHQDLVDSLSKWIHQKKVLKKVHGTVEDLQLTSAYRCPPDVARLVNLLLALKRLVVGGRSDGRESLEVQAVEEEDESEQQNIAWIDSNFKEEYERLCSRYPETDIVVIASEDKKAEIRKYGISDTFLFTVEEVKGLEFPAVIVYRPFDSAPFTEINKMVEGKNAEDLNKNRNLPKKKLDAKTRAKLVPEMNKLFTAMTRTERELVIFQEEEHNNKNLFRLLKRTENKKENVSSGPAIETTDKDRLDFAKKLYLAGSKEKFEEFCRNHLKRSPDEVAKQFGSTKSKSVKRQNKKISRQCT